MKIRKVIKMEIRGNVAWTIVDPPIPANSVRVHRCLFTADYAYCKYDIFNSSITTDRLCRVSSGVEFSGSVDHPVHPWMPRGSQLFRVVASDSGTCATGTLVIELEFQYRD